MSRHSIRTRRVFMALTILYAAAGAAHAQEGAPIRLPQGADAWVQSLAREAQGDINGARKLMLDTYGARPAVYDPCVRLAWLNFLLKDGAEAAILYRRARDLPGSLPEATVGLGLALTMRGYAELARGSFGDARASWQEALSIDAANADALQGNRLIGGTSGIVPEAWAAAISATKASSAAQVYYVQLPVRLSAHLGARVAFRRVASPSPLDTSGVFAAQSEFFGGITNEIGRASIEVLGFILSGASPGTGTTVKVPGPGGPSRAPASSSSTTRAGGAAVSLRVGGSFGLTSTASIISHTGGTNVQLSPMAFVYLTPAVAIAGGVRFTRDSAFAGVSPMAALSVRRGRVTLDLGAHTGKEQRAFNATGPTILSFLDQTSGGFTATAGWQPVRALTLFAQAQVEQTKSSGSFRSVGAGVRLNP